MSRIDDTFRELSSQNKKAFIAYIVAGDPNIGTTLKTMKFLSKNGVDIIELGVPFSDPMAEGPSIQKAHERSLLNRTSIHDILVMIEEYREEDIKTPIVLMGYFNPFLALGVDNFFNLASKAGVDGVLVVDMPLEESDNFSISAKENGLDIIRLIAPTTNINRAKMILKKASGYIYYISLNGVTGSNEIDLTQVKAKIKSLASLSDLPLVVGFGIKDKITAQAVSSISSGVVVGSALVDIMINSNKKEIENSLKAKLLELSSVLKSN